MKYPFLFSSLLLFLISGAIAQPAPGVAELVAAQWYERFDGEARIAAINQLKKDSWYAIDTFFTLGSEGKAATISTRNNLVAPYLDSLGRVIHLVPDEQAKFPGGRKALEQLQSDALGPELAATGETQYTVFIRFLVDPNGAVTDVVEAQSHPVWILREWIDRCLDAVRYMPDWLPAKDRGQAVYSAHLLMFSLK